jgi:hypothetical protein
VKGWLILVLLTLAACRGAVEGEPATDPDHPLEVAAREANVVADAKATVPVGQFERIHAAGRDSLCVNGPEGDYRFAMVASFGTTLRCEGEGRLDHDGERLRFAFDDGGCAIDASYDGDRVSLSGTVAEACSALCGPRASFSGVAVDRVSWDAPARCEAD